MEPPFVPFKSPADAHGAAGKLTSEIHITPEEYQYLKTVNSH